MHEERPGVAAQCKLRKPDMSDFSRHLITRKPGAELEACQTRLSSFVKENRGAFVLVSALIGR